MPEIEPTAPKRAITAAAIKNGDLPVFADLPSICSISCSFSVAFVTEERWVRTLLAPGVELHPRSDLPRFKPAELRQVLETLKAAPSRHKY